MLVTEILDTFGTLVYDRIKAKAEEGGIGFPAGKLPENWVSAQIRPEAKETCRNWYTKSTSHVSPELESLRLDILIT